MRPIFIMIIILAYITPLWAQHNINVLEEGKLYFIALDDVLLPTRTIQSSLEKFEGNVKAILYAEQLEYQHYSLSDEEKDWLNQLDPIPTDYLNSSICSCHAVEVTIIFDGPGNKCDECCQDVESLIQIDKFFQYSSSSKN